MALGDAEAELNLPPGFRFHPTDEELVVNYLARKVAGLRLPVEIIAEVDLYKFDPWNLPEKALFGQKEWYFFTPRDRKYPNGSRPNRAAGRGYWKATGADKPVTPKGSARQVGIKKALVFYSGKAPRGIKTDWIMHEYRLAVNHKSPSKNGNQRLDEWVLCRLYNKKNTWDRNQKITVPEQIPAPRMAVRQEASYSEQHDSFGDSESFHESEIDNTEMRSNGHTEMKIKEDNEWFMDLNLDDLQNPYANFGSGLNVPAPLQVPAGQEYYLSAVNSPHMKFNLSNFMPF